jgi:hypothetical protein
MKTPREPDQGSLGLGKKVENDAYKPPPADDWKYVGGFHWINGKGQRSFSPPTPTTPERPESPAEQWWRIMGRAVRTDVTYIETEWYL